jgi:uncharacterized YccA/Bax inhibitor family protein
MRNSDNLNGGANAPERARRKHSIVPFVNGSAYLGRARFMNDDAAPYDGEDKMTISSVGNRAIICFLTLLAFAVIGWALASRVFGGVSMRAVDIDNTNVFVPDKKILAILGIALVATLVLGIVNAFKREPSKICIVGYAVFEGLLLGAISFSYNKQYDGIVGQAILATLCVVGVSVLVFRTGIIARHRKRIRTFVIIALISYLVLSLANIVLVVLNVVAGWGIWETPIGIVVSLLAVCLGALMIAVDLDRTAEGIERGIAERYSWSVAYAFMLDVVWIYLEILRLLAVMRSRK